MFIFVKWFDDERVECRRKAYSEGQTEHLNAQIAWALDLGWQVEYVYAYDN